MFGYGRAQNVGALVAATVSISFLSLEMFRQAVPKLFQSDAYSIQDPNLSLIVTILAIGINTIPLVDIWRAKERGAAAKAQMVALVEMEIAYVTSLLAIVLITQGYYLADPLASIFVGFLIFVSVIYIFRDNAEYLVGKVPPTEFFDTLIQTALSVPGVLKIHDIEADYVGPGIIHTGIHIKVAQGLLLKKQAALQRGSRRKSVKWLDASTVSSMLTPSKNQSKVQHEQEGKNSRKSCKPFSRYDKEA